MTESEIKTCLDGLTTSEREKFESYLKERAVISSMFQQVAEIEKGKEVFNFSMPDRSGKYWVVKAYVNGFKRHIVVYADGKPKEIKVVV